MPDDPRLTIPVLLGTIRAGRRSAHVARLLLGQLEGRDEVATALIRSCDPLGRRRSGTVAPSMRRRPRVVAPYAPGFQECVRSRHPGGASPSASHGVIGRVRRPHCLAPCGWSWPWGCPDPVALPVSRSMRRSTSRALGDPKLAARVRPFIDELIWYVRALASRTAPE